MKKVVMLMAPGFEEIEALGTIDILRRAGIDCVMASVYGKDVLGSHKIMVRADKKISEIDIDKYDMLILPGGGLGVDNLVKEDKVISIVKDFNDKNKFIAAICKAPIILALADVVRGKKVTSYPDLEFKNILVSKGSKYLDNIVVVDDKIITSRGPATTFEFAYKLVEILKRDSRVLKDAMQYDYLCRSIKDE